jgi:hypothetical protein
VLDRNAGIISVIDPVTHEVISQFANSIPDANSIVADNINGLLYVAGDADSIAVYDPQTQQQVAAVDVGSPMTSLAFNPNENLIYAANPAGSAIQVIDPATSAVLGSIPVDHPRSLRFNASNNTLYALGDENGEGSLYSIDGSTDAITGVITAGGTDSITLDPGSHNIYLTQTSNARIAIMDDQTFEITGSIAIDGNPGASAVNPNTQLLFVNVADVLDGASQMEVIAPSDGSVVDRIPLPNGVYAEDVTTDVQNNLVYAALSDGSALVIDGATNEPLGTAQTKGTEASGVTVMTCADTGGCETGATGATGPTGSAAYNCNASPYAYYVSSESMYGSTPGTVFAVNPATQQVVQSIPLNSASSIAADPIHGVLAVGRGIDGLDFLDIHTGASIAHFSDAESYQVVANNPVNGKVYVQTAAGIAIFSDAPPAYITTIPVLAHYDRPYVDTCTNTIYVIDSANHIAVISGNTNAVTGSFPVPSGTAFVYSLGLDACHGRLYEYGRLTPSTQKFLASFDLHTGAQLNLITLGTAAAYSGSLGVNTALDLVYNNLYPATETAVYDGATLAQVGTIAGAILVNTAVSAKDNLLYATTSNGSDVIVDGVTNQIIATIAPPGGQSIQEFTLGTCGSGTATATAATPITAPAPAPLATPATGGGAKVVIPFGTQTAPAISNDAAGNPANALLITFAGIPPVQPLDASGGITLAADSQPAFSLPFDAVLESIYLTVASHSGCKCQEGAACLPFVQLFTAPPGSNRFTALPQTQTAPATGYSGKAPGGELRAASVRDLGIPLPAGTRVLIVGMIRFTGGDTPPRSSYYNFSGGIALREGDFGVE